MLVPAEISELAQISDKLERVGSKVKWAPAISKILKLSKKPIKVQYENQGEASINRLAIPTSGNVTTR
jgi:hypothetical protein